MYTGITIEKEDLIQPDHSPSKYSHDIEMETNESAPEITNEQKIALSSVEEMQTSIDKTLEMNKHTDCSCNAMEEAIKVNENISEQINAQESEPIEYTHNKGNGDCGKLERSTPLHKTVEPYADPEQKADFGTECSNIAYMSMVPTDYNVPTNNKLNTPPCYPAFRVPFFKADPVNIFQHKTAEELAFPQLYPFGIHFIKSLVTPITLSQYFTCRVLSKDTRWATNMPYLFWALNVYEQHSLQDCISTVLRINPQSNTQLDANAILTYQYTRHVQEDFKFMKHMKGTASYWRDQLYNLLAKMNILEPPNFSYHSAVMMLTGLRCTSLLTLL